MKLCACFLLCLIQLNVWSPHISCCVPHGHICVFVNNGSQSLRFMAMRKLQFKRRLEGLLLLRETSGYDVCGTKMLGSKCICSGAVWCVVS